MGRLPAWVFIGVVQEVILAWVWCSGCIFGREERR